MSREEGATNTALIHCRSSPVECVRHSTPFSCVPKVHRPELHPPANISPPKYRPSVVEKYCSTRGRNQLLAVRDAWNKRERERERYQSGPSQCVWQFPGEEMWFSFWGERRGSDVRGSRDGEDDCSGLGIWKRDCNWRDMFSLSCSDVLLSAGFLIYFVGVRDVAREKEIENVAVKVEK